MSIFNVFTLLGGLAFFLYGMNVMGDALERKAGSKLKTILAKLTSNPLKGFLLGLTVTAIIQSSSATTVMVVGFVNSGIMTLYQSVGIILGANVGTSVTAWILSLSGIEGDAAWMQLVKPENFTPVLAFIGIALIMFSKNTKHKDTALILIGFAVLMFGMETMKEAISPLADSPKFQELLILFSNPLLGLLVGAIMTAIIQSSSASVGILQALSLNVPITYGTAIPIILGQKIGTCVTAMISSAGTNKNAKRAAVIHLIFNVLNSVVLLLAYLIVNAIFKLPIIDETVSALGVPILHSSFSIVGSMIFLPLSKQLVKLAHIIIKDTDENEDINILDERLFSSPSVAIEHCRNITIEMANESMNVINLALDSIFNYDEKTAAQIVKVEGKVDEYEDSIGSYLVKLSAKALTDADSMQVSQLLHLIGDFERISDHAVNIIESAEEMRKKELNFSAPAKAELTIMISAVKEALENAINSFTTRDIELAYNVEPIEEVVDQLQNQLKKNHIKRLRKNECTIELGFVFSDLLTNLERISDHCSNIAVCMIEISHDGFDMHNYLLNLKTKHEKDFANNVEKYSNKYSVS